MWKDVDDKLYQKFLFEDFIAAFAFISKVAILTEKMGHHATITNTYNTVELWLTTHDKGNKVTEKDTKLAAAITAIL